MTLFHRPLIPDTPDVLDLPAIQSPEKTLTYSQCLTEMQRLAAYFQNIGICRGDRCAIAAPNSVEYILTLLTLWSIKAVACPINRRLPKHAIASQIQQIQAKKLDLPDCRVDGSLNNPARLNPVDYPSSQWATIMFTSGTSSQPKAVVHTIDNHVYNALGSNRLIPVQPGDRWLLSLPLYHVGGLSILFRVLLGKGTIVLSGVEDSLARSIFKYRITHVSLVPVQFQRLLSDQVFCAERNTLKAILVGGSAIPDQWLDKAHSIGWPVYTTYGMTETSSQVATGKYPSPASPLPYQTIKISESGEIYVRGKTLFAGYINGDNLDCPLNSDGWFATGDLGKISAKGELHVRGRKDNMFISGGENIQPEEIEGYLSEIEGIYMACVIPVHDPVFGYRPVAFINSDPPGLVNAQIITDRLKDRLPKYKIPRDFYHWPDHVQAVSLKISRRNLLSELQLRSNQLIKIL